MPKTFPAPRAAARAPIAATALALIAIAAPAGAIAPTPATSAPLPERVGWAGRWVSIDAAGAVTHVEPDVHQEPWRIALDDAAFAALRFTPATRDGRAVDSVVWVDAKTCYAGASADPSSPRRVVAAYATIARDERQSGLTPRYPTKALREQVNGWVLVRFEIGADGLPEPGSLSVADSFAFDAEGLRPPHEAEPFATAVLEIARKWHYRAAVVGGVPLSPEVYVPTRFSVDPFPAAMEARTRVRPEPAAEDDDGDYTLPAPLPETVSAPACDAEAAEAAETTEATP